MIIQLFYTQWVSKLLQIRQNWCYIARSTTSASIGLASGLKIAVAAANAMPPPLSEPCKARISQHIFDGLSNSTIMKEEHVSDFTVKKIRRNIQKYGSHTAPDRRSLREQRRIQPHMAAGLRDYLEARPRASLDEMIHYLHDDWDIVCDRSTVSRALKCYGISRKVMQR